MVKDLARQIENWKSKKIKFIEFDKIVLEGKESPEIITVGELAKKEADKWLRKERYGGRAPLIIVDTIFSLRRKYLPMVKGVLRPFYQEFPEKDLYKLAKCDPAWLCRKFTPNPSIGNSNHPLSNISRWQNVVEIAKRFVKNYGDNIDAIHEWAKNDKWAMNATLLTYWSDTIVKGLKGIGISAVQYLRMQAGVDTIKPDSRVKEALSELHLSYRNDLEVIRLCENLARELEIRAKEFDFILWYSRDSKSRKPSQP